nr:hypothetical protein [Tanacetum cinerariifolium]
MMIKLFEIDNERDFRIVSETYVSCQEFNVRCKERREQMIEMQPFLHVLTVLADSYNLLKELQNYDLDKCRELIKSISETQLKTCMDFPYNLQKSPGNAIVPIHLSVYHHSPHHGQFPLGELREASNSTNLSMMWTMMMDREVDRDYGISRRLLKVVREVHASLKKDDAMRCSSLSLFSTRIKRKKGKTTKEGLRKKANGEQKMVDDELVGRKSVQTSHKGKELMYEFLGSSPTKESQVSVTNYKRAIVNGKAKMVEVKDVGLVQPVRSATKVEFF